MLQLTGCDEPPAIDPLPVDFVSGAEGRIPISVSSVKCSPFAFTSTVTFPIPIVGDAASLNSARPSLLGLMLMDCSWSPTGCSGPLSRSFTSAPAPEDVVLLIVTGIDTVSPGLMKRGNAEL